jgi:phenylacetate-coenzyme A ligase PaaK-like adenylate-forming protein
MHVPSTPAATTATRSPTDRLARVRALTAELSNRDRWSREQLLAHRQHRLQALLAHAVERSPFYREVLGEDAARRPLEELPTLSKDTLVDQWDRIVCDRRLTLAGVESHAAGARAADPYLDEFRVVTTSGATGLRGFFVYGEDDWATWVAACLRVMARSGIGPDTRLALIGAPDAVHMSKQLFAVLGGASAPQLSALTPLDEMVESLNEHRPEALAGYAGVIALLADERLHGRLRIEPSVVTCTSEPVTEDIRARVVSAWGFEPTDVYATTEAAVVAASTPEHPRTLEIPEDLVLLEVVDEDGRPTPPGVPGEKVLLTNLANRTQPLIRYELADRVTLGAGPNPAGRPYAHLATIDGRTADTLHLPQPGGGTVAVLPYRLGAPFATLPEVRQFKIVWDGRELRVQVVHSADAAVLERVRGALTATLRDAGAAPVPLAVEAVSELAREGGPAAKFKLVESLRDERR